MIWGRGFISRAFISQGALIPRVFHPRAIHLRNFITAESIIRGIFPEMIALERSTQEEYP